MPDLMTSLQGSDLGRLRILAEHWGIEFSAPDARIGLQRLVPLLLDKEIVTEVVEELDPEVRRALDEIQSGGGRIPWVRFTQRYGEMRTVGPGKRDRERPDRNPLSPAETLWYDGFIARASFDTPDGPVEHAYIPDDLLELLPTGSLKQQVEFGRPASPGERMMEELASDELLDDCCTLLAAKRIGLEEVPMKFPAPFLVKILETGGILNAEHLPDANETRRFLECPRGEALHFLVQTWLGSAINDLKMLPELDFEGLWENNPQRTRAVVLDFLSTLPRRQWWSLSAFVLAVKENQPDFQRPTGDYHSWYIRSKASGEYLKGYEHWDEVEGVLLRYLICGPLFWLGLVDLAYPQEGSDAAAFRLSAWMDDLLSGKPIQGLAEEKEKIVVHSDGRLEVSRDVPRAARYQVARFTDWFPPGTGQTASNYHYRFSPGSLQRAVQQGLSVNHLLLILNNHGASLPPNLVKAFRRWEKNGREAGLRKMVVLQMVSPIAMQALKKSPAGRFLGELLNPTTAVVKEGAEKYVMAALAELGYLSEVVSGENEGFFPSSGASEESTND